MSKNCSHNDPISSDMRLKASEFMPERDPDLTWDVMYPSVLEFVQARLSGRLLQYDPSTEEVTVLARNLYFANGVTVDKDENFILFSETFALRLVKYYLTGEKQGTMENLVDGAPSTGCK
jgi:Strictosidine synthase